MKFKLAFDSTYPWLDGVCDKIDDGKLYIVGEGVLSIYLELAKKVCFKVVGEISPYIQNWGWIKLVV